MKNIRKGIIKDTKVVWCRDGFMYHLCRSRHGIIDTITLSYPMRNGVKNVSRNIVSPFGWLLQVFLELLIPVL
jgi:hypothetical protein